MSIDGFACTVKGVGVAFASMDVRKAKMGALTLGGFNVLEMRDLRLTLYEQATASLGVASPETKGTVLPASDSGDAVETLRTALLPNLRFAGVRISGLKVYRVPDGGTADESKPWLVATELRNSGRQLRLSNVVVNETDGPRALGTALLVVKNGYALAYGKNFGERLKIL